jgi:catechol 2,3-dioxygenase-like lactoylglutathione lyase family enzyme
MINNLRHVGLVVANLDSALAFWCNVMGFKIVAQAEESGPHVDKMLGMESVLLNTVKLSIGNNGSLELLHFKSHKDSSRWNGKPYTTGYTHIALTVSNIDVLMRRLTEHGVKFPSPPQFSPDGRVKVIYASCPDGTLVELVEELD